MSDRGQIVRRSIGIVFVDGGLLALTSTLPSGGTDHGDEQVCGGPLRPGRRADRVRRGAALDRVRRRRGPAPGDARALGRRRGRAAAARGRHPDQLGRGAAAPASTRDRLLPLVGRGTRGAGPLRGRPHRCLRRRSIRVSARIEAVISDFGGVLTTPLLPSFMALQDEIGDLARTIRTGAAGGHRRGRRQPALRDGARRDHRGRLPRTARRRARAAARAPTPHAPLPRALRRHPGPERGR